MEKTNQNQMGTKPIASLIFTMGCPPIVSMFVQSMYNIVDSIFVAQLGENALTAVSLATPIQYILLAVSVGVGVGINSYISRNLGADNIDEANNTVTHSMILALAHSILFIILGLLLSHFSEFMLTMMQFFPMVVAILISSYCFHFHYSFR